MPKKKVEFAGEKEEEYDEVWDPKKIAIGIVVVIFLLIGGYIAKRAIMGESLNPSDMIPKLSFSNPLASPKIQASPVSFSMPNQQDIQKKMLQIQQQVTHLDINDIASSSPQVQQILQQIQNLPKAGGDQVKQVCYRLCDNL